ANISRPPSSKRARNSATNTCSATGWARARSWPIRGSSRWFSSSPTRSSTRPAGCVGALANTTSSPSTSSLTPPNSSAGAGGEFRIGFANNSGTSLSRSYVGNNFPIQLADVASPNPRLTYLSYTQSLLDDKLSVRFGRLTINSVYGEEFAGSQYFKAFTSVGFDLVPIGIFLNAPGAFGSPLTAWGARATLEPVESFYAMVGCYTGAPDVKDADRHGVDFTLRGPAFVIGEVGYRRNYGKDATGLPGNVKLGAYFDGG